MVYKTEDNLQDAFGGESQANRRYVMFADKAEKEGYPQLARMFRAIADAETVHARNHYNAMDAVGTTQDNLLAAVIGEHQEFTAMYPIFIEDAQVDKNARAERSFNWANKVEKIHYGFFEKALEAVKAGETPEDATYYVCQVCGNTVTGEPPEKCPVCGAPAKAFNKVE
ncbi:MAG: rubrerythrin family protein [Dehalococcoidales bacterium]|nr:rubrerythrin family protein [Dehalococcoidales bacterium]